MWASTTLIRPHHADPIPDGLLEGGFFGPSVVPLRNCVGVVGVVGLHDSNGDDISCQLTGVRGMANDSPWTGREAGTRTDELGSETPDRVIGRFGDFATVNAVGVGGVGKANVCRSHRKGVFHG